MPKLKRYESLQNSFYSGSTSQAVAQSSSTESESWHLNESELNQNLRQKKLTSFLQPIARPTPSIQAAPHPTPLVQKTMQPIPSVQAAPHPTPLVQRTMQPIPSVQAASQQEPSKNPSRSKSTPHWMVDVIDVQGDIKKLKMKKKDVLNLSNGERIIVDFDDVHSPIGAGQGILARFCGILATDCSIFPIHFEKWSDIPSTYFNRRFDQFIKKMCKTNAENRKRQTISHIGGSKPNSRRRAEIMAETGKNPGRGQLYLATHKNEDGSYVNEEAKEICPSDAASEPVSPMDVRSYGGSNRGN